MTDKMTVEETTREVIGQRLLTSLSSKDKIAIVATEADLEQLAKGLALLPGHNKRAMVLLRGIRQLQQTAFGPNKPKWTSAMDARTKEQAERGQGVPSREEAYQKLKKRSAHVQVNGHEDDSTK